MIKVEELKALPRLILLESLNTTLTQFLQSGIVPNIFTQSYTSQVPKPLPNLDPGNLDHYRNITVADSTVKLLFKIIAQRLESAAVSANLISENQTGFIKGRQMASQNIFLQLALHDAQKKKGKLKLLFADLSKAFDKVRHGRLWKTLAFFGVDPNLIHFLISIYANSTTQIDIPFLGLSNPIQPNAGVRQGASESPILWILYLQPLLDKLESTGLGYSAARRTRQ